MQETLTLYRIAEFNIVAIHCDQEFKSTLQDFANQHNITLLSAPSQSRISKAERNIKKELDHYFMHYLSGQYQKQF